MTLAAASVWSRMGFLLPFEAAQDAQFFQKPIVSARPPGGEVLSTVNVVVAPGVCDAPVTATKSAHTVRLITLGLGRDGGMMLLGTKRFGPNVVFQPGNTCSQSW